MYVNMDAVLCIAQQLFSGNVTTPIRVV